MSVRGPAAESLSRQAAECYLCLQDPDADSALRSRWLRWLQASPEHRRAFELCHSVWSTAAPPTLPWPTAAEEASDTYTGEEPVPRQTMDPSRCPPGEQRRDTLSNVWRLSLQVAAVAASALLVAFGLFQLRSTRESHESWTTLSSGRGEQKQWTLSDGSTVRLGPQTQLEAQLTATQRIIHLSSGEALFTVVHESRPFRVFAGTGVIEDLGTAFNVRAGEREVIVTVVQGMVQVAATRAADHPQPTHRLIRNQQVRYGESLGPVNAVDSDVVTAWRKGRLAYIGTPLREVIGDLRRYTARDIRIADAAAGELRYSGTVTIARLDQWADGLARVYPVSVSVRADELVVSSR